MAKLILTNQIICKPHYLFDVNASNLFLKTIKLLSNFDAFCVNCKKITAHKQLSEPNLTRVDKCLKCEMVDSHEYIW